MTTQELIVDRYYHLTSFGGTELVFKFTRLNPEDVNRPYGTYITTMGALELRRDRVFWFPDRQCREATPEEIWWLNECIIANRAISKHLTDISFAALTPAIPPVPPVPEPRKQWSVRITDENRDVLNRYRFDNLGRDPFVEYTHMIREGWGTTSNDSSEITMEQFEYYVMRTTIPTNVTTPDVIQEPITETVVREFRIGDTVRIIGNTNHSANRIGDIGIITHGANRNGSFQVKVEGRNSYGNWTFVNEMVLHVEELVQPPDDASSEDILAYCKLKYPIGTKIRSVLGTIDTITSICYSSRNNTDIVAKGIINNVSERVIYRNNIYATILEQDIIPVSTSQSTTSTKTYSLDQLKAVLAKEYEQSDVNDILKLIKTI